MTEHAVAVLPQDPPEAWRTHAPYAITTFRAQCSCGWVGMTSSQEYATEQARRHIYTVADRPVGT